MSRVMMGFLELGMCDVQQIGKSLSLSLYLSLFYGLIYAQTPYSITASLITKHISNN